MDLRLPPAPGAPAARSPRWRPRPTAWPRSPGLRRLPEGIDYATVAGLSNEARQRLREARPGTIGQASRLAGITAATISILLVHLKKHARAA